MFWAMCVGMYSLRESETRDVMGCSAVLEQTYRRISKVDLKFPPHVSAGARDLISKLLVKSPKDRMALVGSVLHA